MTDREIDHYAWWEADHVCVSSLLCLPAPAVSCTNLWEQGLESGESTDSDNIWTIFSYCMIAKILIETSRKKRDNAPVCSSTSEYYYYYFSAIWGSSDWQINYIFVNRVFNFNFLFTVIMHFQTRFRNKGLQNFNFNSINHHANKKEFSI